MDKIIISNLEILAYHGVNEEEKINGQVFALDIECTADLSAARISDCLDDTVSYAKIIKLVRSVFVLEKNDLIERAAHRTAKAILEEFDKLESVRILLKKPHAPIRANFDYVAVEISLDRGEL